MWLSSGLRKYCKAHTEIGGSLAVDFYSHLLVFLAVQRSELKDAK